MPVKRSEELLLFRGAYGRLCALVARALKQGHSKAHVVEASAGKGLQPAPVYVELRLQRERVHSALNACISKQIPRDDLLKVAREAKSAVESEWMITVPIHSSSSEASP